MNIKHWVTMAFFLIFSVSQAVAADLHNGNPSKVVLLGKMNVISDSDDSAKCGAATSNAAEASNPLLLNSIRQKNNTQQTSGGAPKLNGAPGAENPFKALFEKNN